MSVYIAPYLDQYTSKVVGMLWSMLAQQQTWFGNEPWKSYGIQVISDPINSHHDVAAFPLE
jgi:hypothetical protein